MPKHSKSFKTFCWSVKAYQVASSGIQWMPQKCCACWLTNCQVNWWNRKVEAIRKRNLREHDSQDLIRLAEEETNLISNWLFSKEALHEYTKHPIKSTHVEARKLKNYYIKADEKNEMKVEQTEAVTSTKCISCDGNHNLHHCQFYHEISWRSK